MLHALLLLLARVADYDSVRTLSHGAFTTGLVNMGALSCIGTGLAQRHRCLMRG
ncbi:MAG TPA: hypothetical protein VJN89_06530 [Candidatus Acidoferrum sp.]|nr:hypothetical protein [Candidatus Acidoferrum sp.]